MSEVLEVRGKHIQLLAGLHQNIDYTGGPGAGLRTRDDATDGTGINDGRAVSYYRNDAGDWTIKHLYCFADSVVRLDEPGKIIMFVGLSNTTSDLDVRFNEDGFVRFKAWLLSEEYDADFAWDNVPARIGGSEIQLGDVDGPACGEGRWYRIWVDDDHYNLQWLIVMDVPADTNVWGIELGCEATTAFATGIQYAYLTQHEFAPIGGDPMTWWPWPIVKKDSQQYFNLENRQQSS